MADFDVDTAVLPVLVDPLLDTGQPFDRLLAPWPIRSVAQLGSITVKPWTLNPKTLLPYALDGTLPSPTTCVAKLLNPDF